MMPLDVALVRHGQSVGNVANKLSRANDHSAFTRQFKSQHSSVWPLTNLGLKQGKMAGKWLKANFDHNFDRLMVSDYTRARQSAFQLGLDDSPGWYIDFNLRERDVGEMDVMSQKELKRRFARSLRMKKIHPFYWSPPSGESMAKLCQRLRIVLDTLHRECSNMRVIIVCHGEVMWGFRMLLERMPVSRYLELDKSNNPFDHIHNCQILHYTRLDPISGRESKHLDWMRSICPTNLKLSRNTWEEISRPRYTNQQLIEMVKK